MASFLLVRHASADSAAPGARLTAQGQREAEALARRLGAWRFDAAWSSDLERAARTAATILEGRSHPSLMQSPLLREVEAAPEGLLAADPRGYEEWERETTAALAERLRAWLRTAVELSGQGSYHPSPITHHSTILVVSHAGPLRVLICLLLGLPPEAQWSFRLDRASLSVVERGDDMGTLLLLNDRCHLGDNYDR